MTLTPNAADMKAAHQILLLYDAAASIERKHGEVPARSSEATQPPLPATIWAHETPPQGGTPVQETKPVAVTLEADGPPVATATTRPVSEADAHDRWVED